MKSEGLIDFLERVLGEMKDGLRFDTPTDRSVQVARFGCLWSRFDDNAIGTLLHALRQEILDRKHHAPAHGEVVGPRGPIVPNSKLEAFYFMPPLYHAADIEEWRGPEEPETLVIWALPITASEAAFVAREGWTKFEDRTREVEPDFLDLNRESFV